jgi:hypothetical protein
MKINSAILTEAASLSTQIEALQSRRDELTGQVAELDKQMGPLQSKFNSIVGSINGKGSRTVKCSRKGSRFTPEQRAKISEGLRAKWAERKAAAISPTIPATTLVAASV